MEVYTNHCNEEDCNQERRSMQQPSNLHLLMHLTLSLLLSVDQWSRRNRRESNLHPSQRSHRIQDSDRIHPPYHRYLNQSVHRNHQLHHRDPINGVVVIVATVCIVWDIIPIRIDQIIATIGIPSRSTSIASSKLLQRSSVSETPSLSRSMRSSQPSGIASKS